MLLGAQVLFKIIKADQIKINDLVTLQNSVFNYIVTGGLPAADDKQQCFLLSEQEGLESLISKFWQLESIEDEPHNLNSQAKFCEEHFIKNRQRDESGQYIVQMSFLRKNKIAVTSDIKKMFRVIFIDESQRDLLRVVWKDSIEDSIKTYQMNRVVYSIASA
ncbi:DUF1758 domain-containing protein [Trichonephila clavipes]|nr:DUF1758 domain-containing protein [Trichonephila clavipes]